MSPKAPQHYSSDLTKSQRAVFECFLPQAKSGPGGPGRRGMDRGRLLNAILYVVKTGCQWRSLPREFVAWATVYRYFNRWSRLEV
jgi:transposase